MIHDAPEITHLGMTSGQWPVHAFTSSLHAAGFAAESDRNRVWEVLDITLGPALKGELVPARARLIPTEEV